MGGGLPYCGMLLTNNSMKKVGKPSFKDSKYISIHVGMLINGVSLANKLRPLSVNVDRSKYAKIQTAKTIMFSFKGLF